MDFGGLLLLFDEQRRKNFQLGAFIAWGGRSLSEGSDPITITIQATCDVGGLLEERHK